MYDLIPRNGAVISDDGMYRYVLTRTWDEALPSLVWCMLNPSTADANEDDHTIRKCRGFANKLGHGGITVVNLYAFRATDPKDVVKAHKIGTDIVGPGNDFWVRRVFEDARTRTVIAGWGGALGRGPIPSRVDRVRELALEHGVILCCLGLTTAKGREQQPRHPLMLAYETPMTEWRI